MTYHVNDLGDGRYELVEPRPTVVGILTSRRMAERFADFLAAADDRDEERLEEIARFGAELIPAPDVPTEADPIQTGLAIPMPAETVPEVGGSDAIGETPLQEAIRRLEAGETLAVVANETGFALNKLRGIWANRKRREKGAAAPSQAAIDAECTTCGKAYHAAAADEGLCARCTRDLGRA